MHQRHVSVELQFGNRSMYEFQICVYGKNVGIRGTFGRGTGGRHDEIGKIPYAVGNFFVGEHPYDREKCDRKILGELRPRAGGTCGGARADP